MKHHCKKFFVAALLITVSLSINPVHFVHAAAADTTFYVVGEPLPVECQIGVNCPVTRFVVLCQSVNNRSTANDAAVYFRLTGNSSAHVVPDSAASAQVSAGILQFVPYSQTDCAVYTAQ